MSTQKNLILRAGLVAGTLDILAAMIVYGPILGAIKPLHLLQRIAAVLIGKAASSTGIWSASLGLLIHYCIAFTFTSLFVLAYPKLPLLRKNAIVVGLCYGIFVWVVMNMIVLPLIGASEFKFSAIPSIRGAVILMFVIGLPISLITSRSYRSYNSTISKSVINP